MKPILEELGCSTIWEETFQRDSFTMPTEILNDMFTSPAQANEGNDSTDLGTREEKLKELLPFVIKNFHLQNKLDVLVNFFELVKQNMFPFTNICFLLWCDLVKWFSTNDTRAMRYSPECMEFFWVGKKLFGGKFLRFMRGLKNDSEVIKGSAAFDPDNARINFACPDLKCVLNFNPMGADLPETFKPGLMQEMIKYKADNDKDATKRSYVLMLDGKKMKRSTDVDLLGFEQGQTLKQKQEERKRKDDVLSAAREKISNMDTENISDTSDAEKPVIFAALLSIILLFSTVLKELRSLKCKKEYSLNKLKELGGADWRKSKYNYSIDLNMTLLWKIDNCIDKCLQILTAVCKAGAYLNNVGHLFASQSVIDLNKQANLKILKSVEKLPHGDQSDTSIIKQRSDKWMKDRQNMKVTGSTIFQAIGLDILKSQKEHFDLKVNGIKGKPISEDQQKAMDHGTRCEVHHLATMSSVILPFMYPKSIFFEEGYYIDNNILISPDGSIRSADGTPLFAFEGKSPVPKAHVSTVHETVPVRYITQTIYESRALKTEGTLYLCWTDRSCSLFKVPFSEDLCHDIDKEIDNVFHVENPKKPTRISEGSKQIKKAITKYSNECIFLGEFPSVKGKFEESSIRISEDVSSPYETQSSNQRVLDPYTYNELQRALLLGKEVIADSYELQRNMATQVVVYLLADLDRYWKEEQPHAIPVLYFYRGYSLSMETTKQITEMCKAACREKSIDVVVTAADGEFNSIMVRGRGNKPLTQHQLSKDVWESLAPLSKNEMIQIFLQKCEPPTFEMLENGSRAVLKTPGKTMERIKTPRKGWERQMNRQRDDSKMIPIEQESDEHEIESPDADANDESNELQTTTTEPDEKHAEHSLREIPSYTNEILETLKRNSSNPDKWKDVTESLMADILKSADSLNKLIVKDLMEIAKCLNMRQKDKKMYIKTSGVGKAILVNNLSKQIGDGSRIEEKSSRKRKLLPLKDLAKGVLMKKTYPKKVLRVALANYLWPEKVSKWKETAGVATTVDILGDSQSLVLIPYYVPDRTTDGDFEVFVYDRTHLGSNLRKAICLDKVSGVSKKAWEVVSRENPDKLNPVLVEVSAEGKIVDQMKETFAKNMVSVDVEEGMINNGFEDEANFCQVIREGLFEADDTPGISAFKRCEKRLQLIDWLDRNVDFGDFPPYGATIKGISTILYEGLRASSEAKLYLYTIAKTGTYSARAPNTLCSESFFSSMQEMDPWGQGVLTADGIQKHITDFTAITALKMREDRSFYINTKRDKAYPVPSATFTTDSVTDKSSWTCSCRSDGLIKCIVPKDHFFDTEARARGKRKQHKPFKFGDLNDPQRGDEPVRQRYGYKLKDHNVFVSKRQNLSFD